MPRVVARCCGTCKWGRFELTPTGKPKKFIAGRCSFPIDAGAIRVFLGEHLPTCVSNELGGPFHRDGIWPDGGEECGVWEGSQ